MSVDDCNEVLQQQHEEQAATRTRTRIRFKIKGFRRVSVQKVKTFHNVEEMAVNMANKLDKLATHILHICSWTKHAQHTSHNVLFNNKACKAELIGTITIHTNNLMMFCELSFLVCCV